MKIPHILFLSCILSLCTFASSIVVIQGNHTSFGRKYFAGFSSLVREKILAFQYEADKEKALVQKVRNIRPDLIVTIGEVPIERLVGFLPSTPFIVGDYYSTQLTKKANVVFMENVSPIEVAFDLGLELIGKKQKVGTLFDPKYSENTFNTLVQHAKRKSIHVSAIKVDSPDDCNAYIHAFEGKIDFFVAIRDVTTSAKKATDALFAFTQKNKIPVISIDPSHKNAGAILTVSTDPILLGEQAWNVAKVILKEKKIPQMPTLLYASEISLSISLAAASDAGLQPLQIQTFLKNATDRGYQVQIVQ